MNFRVSWLPDAENELAALWVVSTRQEEVARAADRLDRRLEADGPNVGESRSNGRRIAFEPPLAIIFRVYTAQRAITVASVREYGWHRRPPATTSRTRPITAR